VSGWFLSNKLYRVVEHVFERLVNWAAAAIETSSNQPVLPHAIIVLNASENDIDPKLWDVNANTNIILDDLAKTVNQNETFKKYAQEWRQRGKNIETLEQLLLSYYSSVQVRLITGTIVENYSSFIRFYAFLKRADQD
jgi:hypothetical protein